MKTLGCALLRKLPKKLSQQLIISQTIILALVGMVASYIHVKTQERQLLSVMIMGAEQLSGSITSATWHAMLADQREAAYQTMETIGKKQGITRIRIFNKEGRVMFSTVEGDTGQVDKDAEACSMCHATAMPLVKVDVPSRAREFRTNDGKPRLGMVSPIYNEPACSNARCHAHPASMTVLGVLDVTMDLSGVELEVASIRRRVIAITACLVILMSIFITLFTKRFVDAPINQLIAGTKAVSAMELDNSITINTSEELGELARSFNTMRLRLKEALGEINSFTQSLESKVEERTEQLKVVHMKLLHSDRLASLGQLSASVAHEINNPLSGVLNLTMLMQRIVTDQGIPPHRVDEFRRYLSQVTNETARVGRIVQDLLAFSRRSKPQQSVGNLNSIVTTTVNLLLHKLKLMNVKIDLQLEPTLPMIQCDASQIQQVLINLIMNGAEATQHKQDGRVIVRTQLDPKSNETILEVIDNGEGIAPENLLKIFDPFFTTKGEGRGVGLGLAVVYGIIEAHRGDIEVKSTVGMGSTFEARFPTEECAENEQPHQVAAQ